MRLRPTFAAPERPGLGLGSRRELRRGLDRHVGADHELLPEYHDHEILPEPSAREEGREGCREPCLAESSV